MNDVTMIGIIAGMCIPLGAFLMMIVKMLMDKFGKNPRYDGNGVKRVESELKESLRGIGHQMREGFDRVDVKLERIEKNMVSKELCEAYRKSGEHN